MIFAGLEFAHLHPPYDASPHLLLPKEWKEEVLKEGMGERNPLYAMEDMSIPFFMIFAPMN